MGEVERPPDSDKQTKRVAKKEGLLQERLFEVNSYRSGGKLVANSSFCRPTPVPTNSLAAFLFMHPVASVAWYWENSACFPGTATCRYWGKSARWVASRSTRSRSNCCSDSAVMCC